MKQKTALAYVAVVGVLVFVVAMFALGNWKLGALTTTGTQIVPQVPQQQTGVLCASTLQTSLYINAYNALNEASEENFDVTGYLYDSKGSVTSISDTTAPTATTLNCGETYTFKVVSSDASAGDSGRIVGVRSGNAQVLPNGEGIQFVATGATMAIDLNLKQHALLSFRVMDNNNDGYLRYSENLTSLYTTDGATFTATDANATAIAVGTGESIDLTYDLKATIADGDFADYGIYVLVDAATTEWDEPQVVFDGVTLNDIKGNLDVYESRLWSGYEYVFFIDKSVRDDKVQMDFVISALSAVNPSTDVEVDFASKGAAKETLGKNVRISGATDAASPAAIFAVQDTTIDIS